MRIFRSKPFHKNFQRCNRVHSKGLPAFVSGDAPVNITFRAVAAIVYIFGTVLVTFRRALTAGMIDKKVEGLSHTLAFNGSNLTQEIFFWRS